jgi:hypothetical protein
MPFKDRTDMTITTTRRQNLIARLACAVAPPNGHAKGVSPEELQRRMLERCAVNALIWGAPAVILE